MNVIARILVSGLGTGYLPVASGTWGSAAVAAIYLLVAGLAGRNPHQMMIVNIAMAAICVAASVVCVALGRAAEQHFGRKDPSQVTIDEYAGQALALIALPAGTGRNDWLVTVLAAFLAFRFFDIVKPPPANGLQRLAFGWGILVDDLIAGLYANILCQVFLRVVWPHVIG